jgi:hypothetical protein
MRAPFAPAAAHAAAETQTRSKLHFPLHFTRCRRWPLPLHPQARIAGQRSVHDGLLRLLELTVSF